MYMMLLSKGGSVTYISLCFLATKLRVTAPQRSLGDLFVQAVSNYTVLMGLPTAQQNDQLR
jgi:hypothetical protein